MEAQASVTEANSDNIATTSGVRAVGGDVAVTGANMLEVGTGGGFSAKAVSHAILHDLMIVSHQRSRLIQR